MPRTPASAASVTGARPSRLCASVSVAKAEPWIGSNIDGLLGFIEESWAEYAAKITLYGNEQGPAEIFAALSARQRVPP